jgi:molybdopterin-guanine dinucleotide biosynthesis protein A
MFTISIQAGGQSRRMGQDKALLPFLGQPLIQRVVQRVAYLADEVLVTCNHPDRFRFLDLPVTPDVVPGVGALGGLYTALKTARFALVGVVACDLPFANPDLLKACRDILLETGADAVIPRTETGLEPLHAVYRRDTCLPLVEAAVKAGQRRAISWQDKAEIRILTPDEVRKYDPRGMTFWNVNTPEEFRQAEEIARRLELAQKGADHD